MKCINKMKYKVFSKEGGVMECVDQKRIWQGCTLSTHINIFTDGIIEYMSNDDLRRTSNRRN